MCAIYESTIWQWALYTYLTFITEQIWLQLCTYMLHCTAFVVHLDPTLVHIQLNGNSVHHTNCLATSKICSVLSRYTTSVKLFARILWIRVAAKPCFKAKLCGMVRNLIGKEKEIIENY